MKVLFAFCTSLLLFSCDFSSNPNDEVDEGSIENNTYHSDDIGWSMNIPDGWSITSMAYKEEQTEKGSELFEEELGMNVEYSSLNYLLAFQKDQINNFSSTSERWDENYELSWEENNEQLKVYLMDIFKGQGIPIHSSETKVVEIDGVKFNQYELTITQPDGTYLFTQEIYASLINGYDFGVTVMYSNERDKNAVLEQWLSSTFEKT